MADATIHDHVPNHAPAAVASMPSADRPSVLALSAGVRLLAVFLVLAALWAAVYWALH